MDWASSISYWTLLHHWHGARHHTCPALTTFHQPIYELGATAIAQLIDRLEQQRPFAPLTALPPRLVVRESVRQRED